MRGAVLPAVSSAGVATGPQPLPPEASTDLDAAFRDVDEVVFALPFGFEYADYAQTLTDMATTLAPALGWSPS